MSPKVSVIIPTFNREKTLKRAIDSVLQQTFTDFELILIDDGSTDSTSDLLKNYAGKLRSLKIENRGVSFARNLGLREANGEYIAFLDSDDEWLSTKLEKQMQFFAANPSVLVVHTNEIWIRDGVRVNPHKKHEKSGGWIFEKCLPLCAISPSTICLHKSVLEKAGGFKEDYPVCEDYDLWLRISAFWEVGYLPEFLIQKYGGHEDQLSRKFVAMDYWRIRSLYEILGNAAVKLDHKKLVRETLFQKAEILLAGYHKHNNLAFVPEIESIVFNAKNLF